LSLGYFYLHNTVIHLPSPITDSDSCCEMNGNLWLSDRYQHTSKRFVIEPVRLLLYHSGINCIVRILSELLLYCWVQSLLNFELSCFTASDSSICAPQGNARRRKSCSCIIPQISPENNSRLSWAFKLVDTPLQLVSVITNDWSDLGEIWPSIHAGQLYWSLRSSRINWYGDSPPLFPRIFLLTSRRVCCMAYRLLSRLTTAIAIVVP
jgi:hypothetical protein